MPSDVFEEPLELEIGLLEAGDVTPDSYPYPSLSVTSTVQKRTFRSVILENAYLRATFLPALGGRLLTLYDKRTNVEVLSGDVASTSSGRRGLRLDAGIELHLDGRERLTSLGAVQFAAEEPDQDRPAGLWMSEAVTGTGLSWHLHVTLPADRAELRLEARIFNRTFAGIPYSGGILLPSGSDNWTDGDTFIVAKGGNGVGIIPHRGRWAGSTDGSRVSVSRFPEPRMLAPRQLDTWTLSIIPFSGLNVASAVSREAALFVDDNLIQIQAGRRLDNHKLVLLTKSEKTLEAPVDAYPERLLELAVPEPLSKVALLDPAKNVVLRWEGDWDAIPRAEARRELAFEALVPGTDEDLEAATFDIAKRHAAHAQLGVRALAAGDAEGAEQRFEQALLYNAEDHLTWWMKAIAARLQQEPREEMPEILNAHYLAPLEPSLRAESFLSQPQTMEKEPHALLKPLADCPELFVEVAALLVEAGLFEQASRWIDESLRHVDLPMLHYLIAYSHLRATHLVLEAGKHVSLAARQPLGPPYPWRQVEIDAIDALGIAFPSDERLKELRSRMPHR